MRQKKSRDRRLVAPAQTSAAHTRTAENKAGASAVPSAASGYRLETPLICLALVFLAFVAFGDICSKDFEFFNFDDDEYITQNPHVQAGLTADSIHWAFTTFHSNNWHPLTWLSLQLDYMLYGLSPWGYHLTNLLLHAANAVLLFLLLRDITGAVWRSALVAGLFLLHPQRVESVAWAAERKDVLSTLFWMLTMWAYVWYVRKPNLIRYVLVLVAFALGLLAKQMLVTLPCVLLLLDWWPLGRFGKSPSTQLSPRSAQADKPPALALVLEKIPLFLLAAAASVITMLAQEEYRKPLADYTLGTRLANALVAYVQYLGETIWPANLCVLYLHPGTKLPMWQAAAAGVFLAVVTWLFISGAGRRRPYLAVGWLWYLGTLVPVIGLVQVGVQSHADRYTYVPMIGIYIALVWGAAELIERWRWPVVARAAAAGGILLACVFLTWRQVQYWRTPLAMWQHVIEVEPNSYLGQCNVGQLIGDQGYAEEAIPYFKRGIALEPAYEMGYLNLGSVEQRLLRWDDAIKNFTLALQINPKSVPAHNRLAFCALMRGDLPAASEHFTTALELAPNLADAHNGLGLLLDLQNQPKEAEVHFRQALAINSSNAAAHFYLAWVLHEQKQENAAREEAAAGRRLAPDWPRATARLAWSLATHADAACRSGQVAVQQAQIANRAAAEPDAAILDTLAAAYAEAGRFADAVATAKQAVMLAVPEQKAAVEERLKLYESGKPFHEAPPQPKLPSPPSKGAR